MQAQAPPHTRPPNVARTALIDGQGRRITYLRLSVTDRCDLRCRYCMSEAMTFLPRSQVLTIEEMAALADGFIARGVRKIRLTGGEPLMRRGVIELARMVGRHLETAALDELTLTTNGSRLGEMATPLFDAGIRRVNVSLDTRDPALFHHVTRWGDLARVLEGIVAAKAAGLAIKINMVALKGVNEDEIAPMLEWCAGEGHGLTLIETMPLGAVDEDRTDRYLPLDGVRRALDARYGLEPVMDRTGGPARYYRVPALGDVRLGLITPLTENFCAGCNRVRVTASGQLFPCLGHDDPIDLRGAMRSGEAGALDAAIDTALRLKPARHAFRIDQADAIPAVARHMSVTGG